MDIIFDMDGTLMDVSHRVHHLEGQTRDLKSFHGEMIRDKPYPEMLQLLKCLGLDKQNIIIFCTGRSENYKKQTINQINLLFELSQFEKSIQTNLYMRKKTDYRPDPEVKSDLYDQMLEAGFNPKVVFEDRDSVVKMWRKRGLRCLQVAEGNF